MKLRLAALALLAVATAWAGPQSRQVGIGDAKAHFERATALYKTGDLDGAIAELREAIRLKPDDAKTHLLLGVVLEAKGDRQGALEEYRKASERDPKNDVFRRDYERLSKELKK